MLKSIGSAAAAAILALGLTACYSPASAPRAAR